MAAYALRYREELPPEVISELDDLVAYYNNFLTFVNEDGSFNWNLAMGIPLPKPDEVYNPPSSPILQSFLEASQSEGQRWKYGPWTFEDINGIKPNAAVRTIGMVSSADPHTWNDFFAEGMTDCIVASLNPNHNATITGIQASPYTDIRRIMVVTNDTTTANKVITLKHEDTGSASQNRFSFEDATDIELSVGQSCWLLYNPTVGRWTPVVTGNKSGGLVGTTQLDTAISGIAASPIYQGTATLTEAQIISTSNTAVFTITSTPQVYTNQILWPVAWSLEKAITQSGGSTGTRAISALGVTQLIYAHTDFLGFSLANDLTNDLTVGSRQFTAGTSAATRTFSNYTTRNPTNKELAISFSSAAGTFSGTGTSSLRVSVVYYVLASQQNGSTITPP